MLRQALAKAASHPGIWAVPGLPQTIRGALELCDEVDEIRARLAALEGAQR
jgi:hypothetical protein